MKNKIKLLIILMITMLIIIFGKNISFAANYITDENKKNFEVTDGDKTYTQKSTATAETIFKEIDDAKKRSKFFEKHQAGNPESTSSIQMSYERSLINTDIAYCVNKGAHIESADRYLYNIYGYIRIVGDTVVVYTYKEDGGYEEKTYTDVKKAKYLAAAVSVDGPFGGTDGNNQLGYGKKGSTDERYNNAQLMVYYYWNIDTSDDSFLKQVNLDWRHYNQQKSEYSASILNKMNELKDEVQNFVDNSNKTWSAQIIYLSGYIEGDVKRTVYQVGNNNKVTKVTDTKFKKEGLQELILAKGSGEADTTTEKGKRGFKITVKKEWDYNNANENEVYRPDSITISIYNKKENKYIGNVEVSKKQKTNSSEEEFVGTFESVLTGNKEDYSFSEGSNFGWKMAGFEWASDTETEDTLGKYGNIYTSNIPSDNRLQQEIARIAKEAVSKKETYNQSSGFSLEWVQAVYKAANAKYQSDMLNPRNAGVLSGISSDFSYVPVGAVVYGYGKSTSKTGNCGIYIGNNQVAHLDSTVGIMSLEDWIATYRGACWGWLGGNGYEVNSSFKKAEYPLMSHFSTIVTENGKQRVLPKEVSDEEINTWTLINLNHEYTTDIVTNLTQKIVVVIKNKYTPDKEGNQGVIKISGKVFLDGDSNKAGFSINGIDDTDKDKSGIGGVVVNWRTKSGLLITSTKTAADGTYSMETSTSLWLRYFSTKYMTTAISQLAFNSIAELLKSPIGGEVFWYDEDRFNEINESYVEFEYNGYKYTTTTIRKDASSEEDASKASTSELQRVLLDSKFNEIVSSGVVTSNLLDGIKNIAKDFSYESIKNTIEKTNPELIGTENYNKILDLFRNSSIQSLLDSLGLSENKNNSSDYKNNPTNYYKKMLEELDFGSTIGELTSWLNNNVDNSSVLQEFLNLIEKVLQIRSQQDTVTNKLLDIFNIKDATDILAYSTKTDKTISQIKYVTDKNENSIAQSDEKDLNTYLIKASTKNIVTNILTDYKYTTSKTHPHPTNFCDPINKKEYTFEKSSTKYNNLTLYFQKDVEEGTHGRHTSAEMLDDFAKLLGYDTEVMKKLSEFLGNIKFTPDPDVSSGTMLSFFKETGVNYTFNLHAGVNCNGYSYKTGTENVIYKGIKKLIDMGILVISEGTIDTEKLIPLKLYDVKYNVGTKKKHSYGMVNVTDTWEIKNVDCGLVLREQPDAKLYSDVVQAKVVMKGQEYTYKYEHRNYTLVGAVDTINTLGYAASGVVPAIPSNDISNASNFLKQYSEALQGKYRRQLNPADISYLSNNVTQRTSDMEIYVTYYVQAGNQSNTLPMRINKIKNYYDSETYTYSDSYAYEDDDGNKHTNADYKWSSSSGGDSYAAVETTYLYDAGEWVLPAAVSEKIYLTYKVNLNENTLDKLMKNTSIAINNISEISSYTTAYGINTLCVNGQKVIGGALNFTDIKNNCALSLVSGYAGVDKDSRPGNALSQIMTSIKQILDKNGITTTVTGKIDSTVEGALNNSPIELPDEMKGIIKSLINYVADAEIQKALEQLSAELENGNTTGINVYAILSKVEDDTSVAPLFQLEIPSSNYRTISGVVFEDQNSSTKERERLGNGFKDNVEKFVEGVRVELHRLDQNGNDLGIATLYGIDNLGNSNAHSTAFAAVTYTDKDGKYTFGNGSTNGTIEDYYKLYYIYGDDEEQEYSYVLDTSGENNTVHGSANVNGETTTEKMKSTKINENIIDARNYKSTIITNDKVIKSDEYKENWHMLLTEEENNTNKYYSSAVDIIDDKGNKISNGDSYTQRNDITNNPLQNDNYDKKYNMTACTNAFKLGIEYTPGSTIDAPIILKQQVNFYGNKTNNKSNILDEGEKFPTNIKLNFGIIERPRENIIVDKTISNIKMLLSNGQVLFDGDPYSGELPYLIAVGPKEERYNVNNKNNRLVRIEMDTELMQSAELQITYKISVKNDSELDYNTKEYYYYGNPGTDEQIVKGCVPLLVDYLTPDCEFVKDNQENANWETKSIDELAGLVDDNAKKAIQDGKYTILSTSNFESIKPGETKSILLYATKVLATKADNYTFDNHIEILQIDGNRARTIKSVENNSRKQNKKEYKPGNYVIATSGNIEEQDNDRIVIRITPPTGIITRDGYIAILVASLLIVGIGAFIIKKKVLKK